MFFISKSKAYMHVCTKDIGFTDPRQGFITTENGVTAQFRWGVLPDWAWQVAQERFTFTGLADGVDPRLTVSSYDTDEEARKHGWSDKLKADVEASLTQFASVEGHIQVEVPRTAKPWPSYDKVRGGGRGNTAGQAVLSTALEIGVDLEQVLAYEKENDRREDVLETVQRHIDEHAKAPAEAEEVVAA